MPRHLNRLYQLPKEIGCRESGDIILYHTFAYDTRKLLLPTNFPIEPKNISSVSLKATIAKQEKNIAELTEIIAQKDAVIRKYQSMLFDKKSEKGHGRTAKTDDAVVPPAPDADVLPSPSIQKPKRGQRPGAPGHGRRLYDELPPREVLYDLPAEACRCDKCDEAFLLCGTEDSNTVEWEVNIRKVIHRRAKYRRACSCHRPIVITAPAPAKLFPKALMEISTVANLIVNKFLHGQPINRQLNELELHSKDSMDTADRRG